MKRPMLCWACLFILGEVSIMHASIGISVGFAFGMGIAACVLSGASNKYCYFFRAGFLFMVFSRHAGLQRHDPPQRETILRYRQFLLAGVLFYLWGAAAMGLSRYRLKLCQEMVGEEISFSGMVVELEEKDSACVIRTDSLDDRTIHVYIRLNAREQPPVLPGVRVAGRGKAAAFSKASNPGEYDEASYQNSKGVFLGLQDVAYTKREVPAFPVRARLYLLRKELAFRYDSLFGPVQASLAKAMVLGEKSSLDADIRQLYQRNGIAHLIAISGLHIAMIGGVFYQLLRRLTGSYPWSAAAGVSFICAYGLMTGLSGSAVRAMVMLAVSIGADVLGRKYDMPAAIAAALLAMLLLKPLQITQPGFLLSFGAVAGIALFSPLWEERRLPAVLSGFFVSLSVSLTLLPVMLYYFYGIPVYGVLLNVVVVPLMSVLLALLLLAVSVQGVSPFVSGLAAYGASGIFALYEGICRIAEKLPGHTVCTGRPSIFWMAVYYAVLLLLCLSLRGRSGRGRKSPLVLLFMLAFVCGFLWFPSKLLVCVLDVGQGDGIYIRTPYRHHILVDGGSSTRRKVGTYVLGNALNYYGCGSLDYIFISHADRDHVSGIAELLEDPQRKVKAVVFPAITNPDEEYLELVALARAKGCRVCYFARGDSLSLDGLTVSCHHPEEKDYADKNQGSMVLKLTYRLFDMVFTGDMDSVAEAEISDALGSAIEVLKVSHHGSATASSEVFLRELRPETACISVGARNQYGHPAKEVMERLLRYCAKVFLTREGGAIEIRTNGRTYRVRQSAVQ